MDKRNLIVPPFHPHKTFTNNSMDSRTLEFTVLSAEDLRVNRKPVKKNSFAVVKTDDPRNKTSTKADFHGGSYPSWNEKFLITMPMDCSSITLQVQCKIGSGNSAENNRVVGSANVPVSDFVGNYTPEDYLHFLSYRLRDSTGGKNGIINVSVRVKGGGSSSGGRVSGGGETSYACSASVSGWQRQPPPPTVGVPVPVGHGVQYNYNNGGVVRGVPILNGSMWAAEKPIRNPLIDHQKGK